MSYQIDYGFSRKPPRNSIRNRTWIFTLTVFLAFIFFVNSCWPKGQSVLQKLLWPGDPQTTQQALETFVAQIRHGELVAEAVELFCLEILENENIH